MDGSPIHTSYKTPDIFKAISFKSEVSASQAIFRREEDYMAGSLSLCHNFWGIYILEKHPAKKQILSWLRHGVCIEEFLNKKSIGYFEGLHFCSTYPPKRIFNNHIPSKHEAWVEAEIYKALKAGAIKEFSPDFPHVISPLQVHEKTDGKLRLCFDGRYINLFMNPPTFSTEGPQTIPNWGWKGM